MKKKLLSFFALTAIAILAFAATQVSRRAVGTEIWSSDPATALEWGEDNITVAAEKFADAKVGDILHVNLTDVKTGASNPWEAQVELRSTNWKTLTDAVNIAGTSTSEPVTDAAFVLTGDIVKILKSLGAQFNGTGGKVSSITLESVAAATGSDKSIWNGSVTESNVTVSLRHFANANNFTGVKVGDIIRVSFDKTSWVEGTSGWVQLQYTKGSGWTWTQISGEGHSETTVTNPWNGNPVDFVINTAELAAELNDATNNHGLIVQVGGSTTVTSVELIPTYAVNIGEGITGGTVMVDKATAAEGDEVTITATPNDGYKVKSYSVTGVNTNLAVTVNNGKFKMPADDVTVSVTFNQSVDVTIAPASGADISEAIKTELGNNDAKNVTINLTAGASYTVTAPIVANGSVNIKAAGEGSAVIDASELTGNMIQMGDAALTEKVVVDAITVENVSITGLKKTLFYSTGKNYDIKAFTLKNDIIEVAADVTTLDFTKGSNAMTITIDGSTIYAPTATTKSFYSSQSGEKGSDYGATEAAPQVFSITNSTMYNLASGKNFFTHRQNSQKWLKFVAKNNIFADCGKSGQTIKGMNGGGSSANPQFDIDGNVFTFGGADTGSSEETGDADEPVKNTIAGVITFTDAAAGDFNGTLALGEGAAEPATMPGDSRWKVVVPAEDIEISPAEGDIAAALTTATAGKKVGNITVNLTAGVNYTISASIVAPASVTINGNGATIDASALEGNFIQMAAVENPTEWTAADVTIKGITVKGLKKALFFSACKNYVAENFIIDDCVVEQAADATTIDYTKGSTAVNFTVTNSTFYAPTATTKSFYSSQSGQKTTEYNAEAIQTFKFEKNTMYNLAKGKNFFSHRQNSQKWITYDVKNNIFVDCGKSGQVIKGMNGGGSSANPVWDIDGNVFNFGGADTGASESTGDEAEPVKNSVEAVVTFTDAAAGNFDAQFGTPTVPATPIVVGDPRWSITTKQVPSDITIAPESGDIYTALNTAFEATTGAGKIVGNITINLTKDVTYTVSKALVAPYGITINGNGATIDASALEGNMIEMAVVNEPVGWTAANVSIKGIGVKGLKKALFFSACKNYVAENFIIDDCVVEQAADATTIDYTKGSTAKNITVTNSTFYAPTATTKSFYSSQSGQKYTEYDTATDAMQTFKFTNNTMYNLAPGKNFFSHRQSNQKWMTYDVKNNIFVDCGKSGQVIKGMNGGQGGANPVWDIDGNVFNFKGADTSASEVTGDEAEPVKNSVAGRVVFTDATAGGFGGTFVLAPTTTTIPESMGDPRWTLATAASYTTTVGECTGGTVKADKPYAAAGEKVYATFTPAEGYSPSGIVATFTNDAGEDVTSSITFGEDETGSYLIMPAFNITVSAVFQQLPKFYIIGGEKDWKLDDMTEMTYNKETDKYEYEIAPTTTVYFAFSDKQFTAEEAAAADAWQIFNSTNRYSLGEGNVDATLNEIKSLTKGVEGTIVLKKVKEGTSYKISVEKDFNAVTITGEAAPVLPYVVAGSSTELFGTAWAAAAEANAMTLNETTGKYEITYSNVTLSAGDIEYKIVKDGSAWIPDGENKKLNIPAAGTYNVTFTFNPETNEITGAATDATGINGIYVDGEAADIFSDGKPVYNLSGQRVFKGYKGVVIKNGRKVVIK